MKEIIVKIDPNKKIKIRKNNNDIIFEILLLNPTANTWTEYQKFGINHKAIDKAYKEFIAKKQNEK